ncbi:MAG: hypothetical protein H6962_14380 [Chromatiaceae bacterium]|nr:hypothetical protein [Chromatiaceae bacterium]
MESGQKKDALSIYYCVEPHEDGGHTVFVVAISARTPQPQVLPLLHFNRHATAGLLQATTTEQPIAALRRLNALFACLAHFDHADDACEHVVLVEPDVGWMPTRFNRNKGVAEVKTVISAAALSPWRKALLLGCATEQRRILVDTRPNSEIRNDIGNNPKTLAFWPTAEYWVATHHGEPPASASR